MTARWEKRSTNLTNNVVISGVGGIGGSLSGSRGAGGMALGGALYHAGGILTIADGALLNNHILGGFGGSATWSDGNEPPGNASGGALHSQGGTVSITHSALRGNLVTAASGTAMSGAQGRGGAISVDGGSLTLTESTLSDNTAVGGRVRPYSFPAGPAYGGALHAQNANVDVSRTGIVGNAAFGAQNPFFVAGEGAGFGGGVYTTGGGQVALTNATISGNNAKQGGGGVYVGVGAALTLTHVTVANNTSADAAAGLATVFTTVRLAGTVVANNAGPQGNCSGGYTNDGGNLQYPGTTCGAGIPEADPVLGPLQDEGGHLVHPLLPTSAAIEAANQPGCPATDQRGVPRPFDGDDGLAVCDSGSYEFGVVLPSDLIFADGFETTGRPL